MKSLLILRHAKSSWANSYMADHERPLNDRGKQDAPQIGQLLRQEDLVPDLIISSTAERALSTAEAVALTSGYEAGIQTTRQLYHGGPEKYLEVIREQGGDAERVLVVGHNPTVEELVELLTEATEQMSTAALAHVQIDINSWQELVEGIEGKLVQVWRPKEL
ncbi:MAG: histidine phosphatase family protein [Chloroflexota bacterium]|nr:histidine phosphatase family protein [Ardenticatenaceae bacterium]